MIVSSCDSPLPRVDVCVVGAGPVGLALALKLADLGLSVAVLEAGAGKAAGSFATEFTTTHHASPEAATHGGIGGTTALWGGRCVAYDDLDFQRREHVPFSGWPIPHAEMSRYYAEALAFLRCSTTALPPRASSEEQPVHLEAIERWSKEPVLGPHYRAMLETSEAILLLPNAVATEIVLGPDKRRVETIRVRQGSGTRDVSADTFVLAAGGLENARLLLSLQKRKADAFGGAEGPLGRFYQGHLTGYLAVIELTSAGLAADLSFHADEEGYLSRRRMQLSAQCQAQERVLNSVFWTDAISLADPLHGSGTLSLLYLMLSLTGLYPLLSRGTAPRARPKGRGEFKAHLRNIASNGISFRTVLRTLARLRRPPAGGMVANPAGRYLLRYHAEQMPNPESRVQLRETPAGATLSVHYHVGEEDVASVLRSHAVLDEWLRRNGWGRLDYLHKPGERARAVLRQAFDGYHQIGLARMADRPSEGVVDGNCRTHDVDNLYLAGASVFPTGSQANPTLPAVALALRLGEHLGDLVKRAVIACRGTTG